MSNPPVIRLRHLSRIYQSGQEKVHALRDVNLDIAKGEICCIFGPSGSGKSTLLNMMAGMEKPTSGLVEICSQNVSAMNERELAQFRQKNLGFIFQSYNLLSQMTALENTALPLTFAGVDKKTRQKVAAQILAKVGLKERLHHYPSQMSGGQQQRVGIARALVNKPAVIFADEPTGNLDSKTRIEILEMIRDFSRRFEQTVVIVSHDDVTAKYADHTVYLLDGKIVREKRMNPDAPARKPVRRSKLPKEERENLK